MESFCQLHANLLHYQMRDQDHTELLLCVDCSVSFKHTWEETLKLLSGFTTFVNLTARPVHTHTRRPMGMSKDKGLLARRNTAP